MKLTITQTIYELDEESGNGWGSIESDVWHPETLREAITDVYSTRTNHVDGSETSASSSHIDGHTWLAVDNGAEFLTGHRESRNLHIYGITIASKKRLFKLLGI